MSTPNLPPPDSVIDAVSLEIQTIKILNLQSPQVNIEGMVELGKLNLDEPAEILDEEDEATLAAVDQGIQAADAGRVVSLEEVRKQMKKWLTKSSSRRTR
jgi:hypothetical protein